MELVLEQTQQGTSYEVSVSAEGVEELKRKVKIKGEKKEALLTLRQKPEHAEFDESNTYVLERFYTSTGNLVKEILLKLNLPDHRILKDGGEGDVPNVETIMGGRSTRRNTANNTNPPNKTTDEVARQLYTALPNLLTQLASGAKEFFGTEGAVGLLTWFESIESVLHITKCPAESQVEFQSNMLQGRALTWWITLVQTRGRAGAIAQPWEDFKKLLMEEYCPDDEVQKLET
ncbi:hypothetical protein Tco_1262383 [Tanacetum coccineum]